MALFAGESVLISRGAWMPSLAKCDAAPAAATVRNQDALARAGEIGDGRALLVKHQRADGTCRIMSWPEWPVQLEPSRVVRDRP